MRQLEKLVITALDILEQEDKADKTRAEKMVNNGCIDPPFKGYVASFGAAIVQSGLLPAVIFFENDDSRSEAERKLVPATILKILLVQDQERELLSVEAPAGPGDESKDAYETKTEKREPAEKLSRYIAESKEAPFRLLRRISSAAVALKIAMRTYSFEPANNDQADA